MEHHSSKKNLAVPIAIVIAGALIAAALFFGNKNGGTPTADVKGAAGAPAAKVADVSKVKTAGAPFIGAANAPATMAFWSDYQCPFCKKFDQEVISKLITDYVSTGKLKIIFKDFVFLGDDSKSAALVARAVWEAAPDKFRDWHEAMFQKQDGENSGWGSKEDVLALTKTILGNDLGNKVASLVSSKEAAYQAAIDADRAEGSTLGVSGTPASIVGKSFINGAQPYATVKAAVEKSLTGK